MKTSQTRPQTQSTNFGERRGFRPAQSPLPNSASGSFCVRNTSPFRLILCWTILSFDPVGAHAVFCKEALRRNLMANHVSSLKRIRVTRYRTAVNRMRKTRLRHQLRALRRLIEANNYSAANELLPKTFSIIDRAAKWGIIHSNTADRYKARLHKRIKALAA